MKIGRNATCPCGSGKKYKKCCLQKDEAKQVEERTVNAPKPTTAPTPVDVPPADPQKPDPPPDPLVEKRNALFDTFQSRDYEGRIELFLSSMDEPELLDDEGAFEMLNNIHPDAVKRGEYARFNDLVDTLSQKLPELYADSEAYHLDWYISNALVLDQPDVLANKVRELAEISYSHLNIFHWTVDRLAYHGYLPLLIKAMRIAWPEEKAARDIMGFAIDEFTETAINFEIFDYIVHHPEADPDDPDLLGRLKNFYDDIRTDVLTKDIMYLSARVGRRWSQDDFGNLESETSRMDLIHLSREFLGELYREQGMSITRGELGRYQLVEYLLKRFNGDLEPTPIFSSFFASNDDVLMTRVKFG